MRCGRLNRASRAFGVRKSLGVRGKFVVRSRGGVLEYY